MKSIFTKLTTLLLSGAVVLVGCSDFSADIREVNKNLEDLKAQAATKTEVAALKTTVEELSSRLTSQFATKEEVAAVQKALTDAKTTIESALAGKADKTAVDAAIADLQKALTDAKADLNKVVADAKAEITGAIDGILTQISTLSGNLETLAGELDTLEGQFTEYQTKIDAEIEAIKAGFEQRGEDLDEKFAGIDETAAGLATSIKNVNDLLLEKVAGLQVEDKAIADALAAFEAEYNEFISGDYEDLIDTVDEIIEDAAANYDELSERIDALEDYLADLEDMIGGIQNNLNSIVSVPQMIVNGVNAIEFKSLVFVPMADDTDEVTSVAEATEVEFIPAETFAYYHFNPSTFDLDDADYSIVGENVQILTKAAGETVATVEDVEYTEDGKVKATLLRAQGEGNMFALAATLDNGAVVYSDYVQIIDNQMTAEDITLADKNGKALYTTLAEVEENEAEIKIMFGESYDFSDYAQALGVDLKAYNLDIEYSLFSGKSEFNNNVLNAVESSQKTENIVRIELVDEDGCVVRRAYVKVYILGISVYYNATATAQVAAERVAFEVADIEAWAKSLKDAPNTTEILMNTLVALIDQNYYEAYQLVGGVPGFVKKYTTFTGVGTATVKVEDTISGTINSLIPEINLIDSIEDLKLAIIKMEAKFEDSAISKLNSEILAKFIPNINSIPGVSLILDWLLDFRLSDFLDTKVVDATLKGIEKYVDFQALRAKLVEIATGLELDSDIETEATAEAIAEAGAKSKAESEASLALLTNIETANEKIRENFKEGTWGKLYSVIDNEIAEKIFEKLQITDTYVTLMSIAEYALSYVDWSYDIFGLEIVETTAQRTEVIE